MARGPEDISVGVNAVTPSVKVVGVGICGEVIIRGRVRGWRSDCGVRTADGLFSRRDAGRWVWAGCDRTGGGVLGVPDR